MKSALLPQIIPSLKKFHHKIISIDQIREHILKQTQSDLKNTQIYKIIYHLKSKGHIISCKKDLFFIKPSHTTISEDQIIAQRYWKLLAQHCSTYCGSGRYIGGLSALELHTGISYVSTDNIIIINKTKNSNETICFDKKVHFKMYKDNADQDLYTTTKKLTQTISVPGAKVKYATLELAMIESLYSPSHTQQGYIYQYITKLLKKHKKSLQRETFEIIIKSGKFHSSFNRLHKLMKDIDNNLTQQLQDLIKKYSYVMDV